MKKTIVLNVEYTMKPGGAQAYVQELLDAGILQQIRAWEGCLKYEYYRAMDSDHLLLIEWWSDQEALSVHQSSDYFPKMLEIQKKYSLHTDLDKFTVQ